MNLKPTILLNSKKRKPVQNPHRLQCVTNANQWPPSWHQNNCMFWLTITFSTVFCLVLWDVLAWPRWVRDIILALQKIIIHV